MTTPAHDLARSRKMIGEADVDLIQSAVESLDAIRDLAVYDLGAGSGTTAATVLSVRPDNVHGTTLDISQENLDWSYRFITQTWKTSFRTTDPIPVPGTKMVAFDPPHENSQWRWALSRSVPSWKIRNRSVHFLMIDTSHEYEDTLEELTWWRSKMATEHYVWLDDYTTLYPGVMQAVDEAINANVLEFVAMKGQSILCRFLLNG